MKKIILLIVTALGGLVAYAGMPVSVGDSGADANVTFPPSLLIQNGGPILDIKNPPDKTMHAAVGDGVTDDTAAFQDAYDLILQNYKTSGWPMRSVFIYIPNGTYLINDTIMYRGPLYKMKDHFDICRVRFVGQSRAKTLLRLADKAPNFQDKQHPRPMISFQHPDTTFNNVASTNTLRNLTISVGNGNPGAVGVMFQSANQSDIHNVTITSGDGSGAYGLWFKIGSVQGYYSDVTIQGFDYGLYDAAQPENSTGFENLTLKQQNIAGIDIRGGNLALNNVLSDQKEHGVPALKMEGGGAQAIVLNSTFTGGSSQQAAIELTKDVGQSLLARNVTTEGYGEAIKRNGVIAVAGARIDEYVTTPAVTLVPNQSPHSLALPIEATPQVPWFNPATDWAIVDDYPSLQDAMNSGKPVICFKQASYQIPGDVHIPASVKFINFLGSRVKGGAFVIDAASTDPLLIQDGGVAVKIQANRNLVERCSSGPISNEGGLPVTLFLENVNDCTSGDNFCRPGQKVFARGIDVEYKNVQQIVCNGGTLWVYVFKTENSGAPTSFVVKNGGSLEVLGGYVNMLSSLVTGPNQPPMIINDNSNASITCSTNMTNLYDVAVREIRDGTTRDVLSSQLPSRGGGYTRNFVIPLYVGTKATFPVK